MRVTVDEEGEPLGFDDYYPYGLQMPTRSSNTSNPNDRYKFTGNERDTEAGLTIDYFGARYYDPMLGSFYSIDRFYEKYPSLSPYQYTAGNPITFVDVNGDSIWVTQEGDEYTVHYQGKIINNSDKNIDMNAAAKEIAAQIEKALTGQAVGLRGFKGKVKVNVDLQVAKSQSDINDSDHVIRIADMSPVENHPLMKSMGADAKGFTPQLGSKISIVDVSNFRSSSNPLSALLGTLKGTSVTHEVGHQFGLKHPDSPISGGNLMNQGRGGSDSLTNFQRGTAVQNANTKGAVNLGNNKVRISIFGVLY